MIGFTKPFPVIRRSGGSWVEGRWTPAAEPAPVTLPLNVQPAQGTGDDLVCFAAIGALTPRDDKDGTQGDIVVVNGERFVVLSRDRWDVLGGADTAHDRYVLTPEKPKAAGEV